MKNRYIASFAALVAMLVLLPLASRAQTITTLLSQNFNGATMPPAGWSSTTTAASDPCTAGVGTYWYHSAGGNGGVGGATYGSAVAWTPGAYNSDAYGTSYNGYYCGPLTLTTPALTTLPADSQYVDFDLWYPYGCYMLGYAQMATTVKVLANASNTVCLSLAGGGGQVGDCTWTNTSNTIWCADDPASYSASSYWRHYHIPLPYGVSSQTITFQVAHGGSATYTYWYTDNVAFTNVVVTNVHYPLLTFAPANLNFGTVPVLQSAGPYYVVLTNPNPAPIAISSYGFGGANPGDFTLTRSPASIPAGGKDSVGVLYAPQGTGSRAGILTVKTNAPQTINIPLLGQGVAPTVSYSATNMFRGVNTEVTNTSGVQYLYVNSTSPVALTVKGVTFFGIDASAYTVTHVPVNAIPGGGVDSIGVKFTPDLEGIPDAHMVVSTNASNIPLDTVALYGVGILPHLTIDNLYPNPITVNFDSVKLGTDTCLMVTLTNPGSDTIAIVKNYFESADFDFSITPLTGQDTLILPGGSKNIQICFTPLQQGYRTATLRINTNIPHTVTNPPHDTSQFVVNIIGTGVPSGKLLVTGPSTNGTSAVGKSACVTDTLWNTGNADLSVTSVTITGTNAADFTPTLPAFPFTLKANSGQPFTVCATPTDTGAESALLTASGVTAGETSPIVTSVLALSVYGTAVRDTVIVAQAFAATSCGSDTETVTVTNTGNVPTTYAASISGSNASQFSVTPGSSSTENGGGIATFKVVFTPTGGAATATLNITGGAAVLVPLSAIGGTSTIAGTGDAPMTFKGATSAAFPVVVNNTGTCPWTSGTTVQVDPQFTYSGGSVTIPASGSATMMFTYTPTSGGGNTYPVTFPGSTVASSINVSIVTALDDVNMISASNGYRLDQNYPNPFSGMSTIEITLPVAGIVHMSIVDVQGQTVQTVLSQHFDAGTFGVSVHADGLASGTYYYQMTAGNITLTRQMVVIK